MHWYARNTDLYKKVKTVGPTPLETCRNEKSSIQSELDDITNENSLLKSVLEGVTTDLQNKIVLLQSEKDEWERQKISLNNT